MRFRFVSLLLVLVTGCVANAPGPDLAPVPPAASDPYVVVLGIAQDGGYPQAGCNRPHCLPGWNDPSMRRLVASIAVVDPMSGERWLVDATPDFPLELRELDVVAPPHGRSPGLDGIFLTHAHIGHYTGLMHLGREVIGSKGVPVWAMPRMKRFLESNGPWDQLVRLDNIEIHPLEDGVRVRLNDRLSITPFLVPHRDEYSETVGFRIEGPRRTAVYIPDIDKWARWTTPIESVIRDVDIAWVDGTFFADGELGGRRAMSEVPHPFIVESLQRFEALSASDRNKIRFIHLNHTNPTLWPGPERERVEKAGCHIAVQGERLGL